MAPLLGPIGGGGGSLTAAFTALPSAGGAGGGADSSSARTTSFLLSLEKVTREGELVAGRPVVVGTHLEAAEAKLKPAEVAMRKTLPAEMQQR